MPDTHPPADAIAAEAFSVDQVVALTTLGRTTVFEEIREGRLRARKCGARTIILADDLRRWLASLPDTGNAR